MGDAPSDGRRMPGRLKVQWPPPPIPKSTILQPMQGGQAVKPAERKPDPKPVEQHRKPDQVPAQPPQPPVHELIESHQHPVPNSAEQHQKPAPVPDEHPQPPVHEPVEPPQQPPPISVGPIQTSVYKPVERAAAVNKWMPKHRKTIEKLGEGTFGIVWKCCDPDSLRLFVAKETIIRDEEYMKIAENEVERLKELDHEHVITYYGSVKENHAIVIYMEYFPAGSLRQMIENVGGPLAENTAVIYIRQILEGLEYIHQMMILHCDLKCDNLLLDGHGKVKIGDFGIAVQMCLNNANQSVFMQGTVGGGGTLYWMAPEVIRQDNYGRTADIWSLGCTIIEMLTTLPPYCDAYPSEAKFMGAMGGKKLSYNPKEIAPDSSVPMQMFLSKVFVYDPQQRLRYGVDAKKAFQQEFPC